MYIDLSTNENATEVSRPFKEQYDFSLKTVKNERIQQTTPNGFSNINVSNTRTNYEPRPPWTLSTVTPRYRPSGSRSKYIPEIVHWPPFSTESTEFTEPAKSSNPLYTGIFSVIAIVALVWAVVIVNYFRNKLLKIRERRRQREPPSYSNMLHNSNSALASSDFSNMGTNSQLFGSPEHSEFNIARITVEDLPSFTMYQPSAPSATTSQSCYNEQPPSYIETQQLNHNLNPSHGDPPPSYLEAQQQRAKVVRGT